MIFQDLLDLYVLRKACGLPVPELWERAVQQYFSLMAYPDLTPQEAKGVMDEALACIERESEAQARRDRGIEGEDRFRVQR